MINQIKSKELQKWTRVLLDPDPAYLRDLSFREFAYKRLFTEKLAGSVYELMRKNGSPAAFPVKMTKPFNRLQNNEKRFWLDLVSGIPEKYLSAGLYLRPYSGFCRTCLITDGEIEHLAICDHSAYMHRKSGEGWKSGQAYDERKKTDPFLVPFKNLPEAARKFFCELNYVIPSGLKKIGFEVIRPEEATGLNEKMIKKIARAIHSRYLRDVNRQKREKSESDRQLALQPQKEAIEAGTVDFDQLPDEIKYSNIDNAYHIPAKLLSIGYRIRPAGKGYKPLALHLNEYEVEAMARVEHLRWSWDKRLNGWIQGKTKDTTKKIHPDLKPYEELSDSEKDKDRELVRMIPSLLQDIDYEACPVNPGSIKKLSYAIRPQSSVRKILDEIKELNDQLRKRAVITPEMEVMIGIRNSKIQEAIDEIEGSYKYARHIQETFLPDDLYVRECFPESFIFFRPKDIVSGDFYFFSKRDHHVIFAAADCTGHGIPGALLSTIGYETIDQAVNQLGMTDPSVILQHLYTRIHRFLKLDIEGEGLPDDMDIVLCNYNLQSNLLTYSSVNSPFCHIRGTRLTEHKPNNLRGGCRDEGDCSFISDTILLRQGDLLYLFSDGYADQFGGKNHKKYQNSRFMSFLQEIRKLPMPEQCERLFEELEEWREENNEDQTDDVLVMGIRV